MTSLVIYYDRWNQTYHVREFKGKGAIDALNEWTCERDKNSHAHLVDLDVIEVLDEDQP
jgi:hypothetical protein